MTPARPDNVRGGGLVRVACIDGYDYWIPESYVGDIDINYPPIRAGKSRSKWAAQARKRAARKQARGR